MEYINLEKYFFNVYLLLESDEEILYLTTDEQKENNILEEIKNYDKIQLSYPLY